MIKTHRTSGFDPTRTSSTCGLQPNWPFPPDVSGLTQNVVSFMGAGSEPGHFDDKIGWTTFRFRDGM